MTRLSRLRFTLGLSCRDRGILPGTERRDPGQRFPVQHVEPLPLRGQFPAPLIEGSLRVGELATQEGDLIPQVVNEGVRRRWVRRWGALGRLFGRLLGRRSVGVGRRWVGWDPHPPVAGVVAIPGQRAPLEAHSDGLGGDPEQLRGFGDGDTNHARSVGRWVAVGTAFGCVGSVAHGRNRRTQR